jgi:Tol biopolymer transport system component
MRSSVEVFDLDHGTRVLLQSDLLIEAPNWAPEGDALLVNAEGRLWRVPLADPRLIAVDTGPAIRCNNDHGITPDGRFIILSSHHENEGSEIYLMPRAGGDLTKVSPMAPSWWHGVSPDGAQIAYAAARENRIVDICVCPLMGGPEQRLTFGEGHCDGPDYSADGREIYYNCDRSGHAQIWVMGADGSNQRQLFADEKVNWFPHPSPDGQKMIYLAYPAGTEGHPADRAIEIVLCKPDGSSRKTLMAFNGGQGTMNVPNWSPDSRAFAFVRYAAP